MSFQIVKLVDTPIINISTTVVQGWLYLGDPGTQGTWRIGQVGNNLSFQRFESGVWVEKDAMTP